MKNNILSITAHVIGAAVFTLAATSAITAGPVVSSTVYVISSLIAWALAALVAIDLRPSVLDEEQVLKRNRFGKVLEFGRHSHRLSVDRAA